MKRSRKSNLFAMAVMAALLMFPMGGYAQSKVGHVSTQKLLEMMPEVKVANAQLDTVNKTYQAQMKALLDEYQKQQQDLQDQSKKYPDPVLQDKRKAFQALTERIQAFRDDANADIQKKQEDLMTPIRKKLADAIQAVAIAGKYDIVLDGSQQGVVLYAADNDDLTEAVMKKLGLK